MQTGLNSQYMKLDAQIEAQIKADRASGKLSAFRFNDEGVTRRLDLEHDKQTLARPAFVRDVEKIVNVPAYNRYAGKTQVFSFVENDDITRRGLHVQLVSHVARGIGRLLGLNCDLIEAIALGHDVGHTPFGHAGEHFLSKIYHAHTGLYFNHNVHSVRVLDQLYPRNISLQTLDGVLCHNGEFAAQELKRGNTNTFEKLDFLVNECNADESKIGNLRPSTLEGCVVRVADMIAYVGKDRQDARNMGVIDSLDVFSSKQIGKTNAAIINNLTVDIVNNSYGKNKICMSEGVFEDLKRAKNENFELIYSKEGMIENTSNIVEEMFGQLYEALLDDILAGKETSPIYAHHIKLLEQTSVSIDAKKYAECKPNKIVCDYIASMTDNYFMSVYSHMFPNKSNEIPTRDYCRDLR
jgi:dGTPase